MYLNIKMYLRDAICSHWHILFNVHKYMSMFVYIQFFCRPQIKNIQVGDSQWFPHNRDLKIVVYTAKGLFIWAGPARLTGLTRFFRVLWWLKYSGELKLKGIAALSNLKAGHQAKQNVMLLKSKDFRNSNQPGYLG